ncbi:sugar transporter domain-containing protein [Trichoderma longibrachiatum]|uniref:General substrate transporter n=1 Tax=Trichoderma longibrachiatum ATCC 18648 TaxID=983965 RepID=A0A2T4BR57_TRILO|nr:general substrate transporter [Trichoderma longibrachiatum ATCC 18648]
MTYKISNIYVITAFLVIGGLLQGFDISSLSAILSTKPFKERFDSPTAAEQGGITASISGGSFLGCLVNMLMVDNLGRRHTLMAGCIIFVIGSILCTASIDIAMLIVGRLLCGGAVGIFTSTGPLFLAELSRPETRGRILSFQQWSITWGALIMYYITFGTSYSRTEVDRWEEALAVLASIHAQGNRQAPIVQAQYAEIRESMAVAESQGQVTWAELIHRDNILRISNGIFVHIWTQLSGNNALLYYIVYIFQMAGLTGNVKLIASSIQYVINVVFTLPAILLLDRIGRRPALVGGAFFMMIWLYSTAGVMAQYGHHVPGGFDGSSAVTWTMDDDATSAKAAVIAFTYLLVATYSFTWAPISWCYPSEIYPIRLRGKAVSIATSANWILGFANNYYTPPAFQNIQWKTFVIFGTFNVVACLHAFFFFPETKRRSLEDIDELFATGIKPWKSNAMPKADKLHQLVEEADMGKLQIHLNEV